MNLKERALLSVTWLKLPKIDRKWILKGINQVKDGLYRNLKVAASEMSVKLTNNSDNIIILSHGAWCLLAAAAATSSAGSDITVSKEEKKEMMKHQMRGESSNKIIKMMKRKRMI